MVKDDGSLQGSLREVNASEGKLGFRLYRFFTLAATDSYKTEYHYYNKEFTKCRSRARIELQVISYDSSHTFYISDTHETLFRRFSTTKSYRDKIKTV